MTHQDHVALIMDGIETSGGLWADLGSGSGAFTLALRDVSGPSVRIFSVDKDNERLTVQQSHFDRFFPKTNITYLNQDFTQDLPIPPLDGLLMANSLHYVKNQERFFKKKSAPP